MLKSLLKAFIQILAHQSLGTSQQRLPTTVLLHHYQYPEKGSSLIFHHKYNFMERKCSLHLTSHKICNSAILTWSSNLVRRVLDSRMSRLGLSSGKGHRIVFLARHHSRPQRPRSFWSALKVTTSGQVQLRKSAIHGLPVTLRML